MIKYSTIVWLYIISRGPGTTGEAGASLLWASSFGWRLSRNQSKTRASTSLYLFGNPSYHLDYFISCVEIVGEADASPS